MLTLGLSPGATVAELMLKMLGLWLCLRAAVMEPGQADANHAGLVFVT